MHQGEAWRSSRNYELLLCGEGGGPQNNLCPPPPTHTHTFVCSLVRNNHFAISSIRTVVFVFTCNLKNVRRTLILGPHYQVLIVVPGALVLFSSGQPGTKNGKPWGLRYSYNDLNINEVWIIKNKVLTALLSLQKR